MQTRGLNYNSEIENAYKILTKNIGLDSYFKDDTVNSETRPIDDSKKSEVLQMIMLRPNLIILDEIDQDIEEDSLEYIAMMVSNYTKSNNAALVVITHNQKFLDKIQPNFVHVLVNGKICEQGSTELYKRIIEDGYSQFSQS